MGYIDACNSLITSTTESSRLRGGVPETETRALVNEHAKLVARQRGYEIHGRMQLTHHIHYGVVMTEGRGAVETETRALVNEHAMLVTR